MDKRFFSIFNLTQEQCLTLLKTPLEELEDKSDRYVAASNLVRYPGERTVNALIETIEDRNPDLYHRIARRKAVESLGRLQASVALPIIRACLQDEDCYTVENAVLAIGEIGTQDQSILEEIAQLLDKPGQNYRIIIQTLAKFDYHPALEKITNFIKSDDEPTTSAAISAVARFTGDYSNMAQVVALLEHESVNARRACIQDLIDAKYYGAIGAIAQCPISIVFRLRGIRMLAASGLPSGEINFAELEPILDQVIRDHPDTLEMVHIYDQTPSIEFLINELYHTDFGRCYLAAKTLLEIYAEQAPQALLDTYAQKAYNDYGAHYHVVKLLGWLQYQPAYDLLVEALHNRAPQFQKSRGAAALALANLGDKKAIPLIKENLNTGIFDLKYASLLALAQLGDNSYQDILADDQDILIQAKLQSQLAAVS